MAGTTEVSCRRCRMPTVASSSSRAASASMRP
ncbi:Uncharacterised protein [Bordetella pertussis]|nr:Uncharacterised protein [Bordetella pertussis]